MQNTKSVRPFHLMCLFCRMGKGSKLELPQGEKIEALLEFIRANPQAMLEMNCNCANVYSAQNPGTADDQGGVLLNKRRDLNLLRMMKMTPGQAKPAKDLVEQIAEAVKSPRELCIGKGDGPWQGCPYAVKGYFESTVKEPSGRMVQPPPTEEARACLKAGTAQAVAEAKVLKIRPHHLLCLCCFYGRCILGEGLAPIAEDNLCEVIQKMQREPDIPVEFVEGCCMICPPCSLYQTSTKWCLGGGMALRDEHKDLEVLYKLGMKYGDVTPARELWGRLFNAVAHLHEICAFTACISCSGRQGSTHEWRPCASLSEPAQYGEATYELARRDGLGIPGAGV